MNSPTHREAVEREAEKFAETETYCDSRFTATNAFKSGAQWGWDAGIRAAADHVYNLLGTDRKWILQLLETGVMENE